VRNGVILHGVKEKTNIVYSYTVKIRKAKWIGYIWRRDCFLKNVIDGNVEGMIEVTRRRGRRYRQLLDNLRKRKGTLNQIELCEEPTLKVVMDL
jgi:hypothetical protein